MNIANFINIHTNIYIPILYVTRMTQNKNDALNSILQHGRVVDNNCYVVFPTSRFPYLIFDTVSQIVQIESNYHLLSYKD